MLPPGAEVLPMPPLEAARHFFSQLGKLLVRGRILFRIDVRQDRWRLRERRSLRSKPREQRQLLARKEAQIQPAEDVVHQALRVADLLVARPARGLEPGVRELLAQHAQRNAMLQCQRNRSRKRIHQAGDGRTFLCHLDEDLARLPGRIQTHRDVALMTRNRKLVGDGSAFCLQAMTHGTRRPVQILQHRLFRP